MKAKSVIIGGILLIFCLMPHLITSASDENNGEQAHVKLHKFSAHHHDKHHSLRHNRHVHKGDVEPDVLSLNNDGHDKTSHDEESDGNSPLLELYRESHITKDAAKRLRKRLKAHKISNTDDYEEILDDILAKQKHIKPKHNFYEKKYYDYLPTEDHELDSDTIKEFNPIDDTFIPPRQKKRINSRRMRRSVDQQSSTSTGVVHQGKSQKKKRQLFYFPQPLINYNQGFGAISPQPIFYYNPSTFPTLSSRFPTDWGYTNPFIPRPSFINPPFTGYYYPQPYPPFCEHPGMHHPMNPSMHIPNPAIPQKPITPVEGTDVTTTTTTTPVPGIGNRFGEDGWVWDVERKPTPNGIRDIPPSNGVAAAAPPTTKRPSPPLFHESNDYDDLEVHRPQATTQRPQFQTQSPQQQQTQPPRRTPPPLFHESNDYDDLIPTVRPPVSNTVSNQRPVRPPSPCVLAISNCCVPGYPLYVDYQCFEDYQCYGSFWDVEPCSTQLVSRARTILNRF